MPIQRFRTDEERNRRGFGWTFVAAAVVLTGGLAWRDFQSGRVSATAVVLFTLFAGLFAIGVRLLLTTREAFDIDTDARTYSLTRDGNHKVKGPLDDLGPIEVEFRVRLVGPSDKPRERREYVVHGKAHSDVDLYVETTAGKARRRMETLAKAWRLPCRSLGGALRGPDELDVPLHDRLRDDGKARKPAPLRPEWGVTIEPLSLGYAVRSTNRSWRPVLLSGFIAVFLGWGLFRAARTDFLTSVMHDQDPMGWVLLAGFVVVGLVGLGLAAQGVRDTFFPGTVLVTDRGVSYRFARLPFREIEELTSAYRIEIIGDRRSLALGQTFCPVQATDAVAHEIQRLIIEVAEANPHARAAS
jgi:hypothetical protein